MDFDHDNVRSVVNEDRLSSLPDELIHKILSCLDIKFSVQTCLLSPRWKFVWTSMPCLNFSSVDFDSLPKFAKFVKHFLSRRSHQTGVSSVKLYFHGAASQVFVRKIVDYAFSHNVQELTVLSSPKNHNEFPPCLFSSQSLKHFTLRTDFLGPCRTPTTPWDFPALTSLYLSFITLCDEISEKSVDLFSKCVNLKNLTLESFLVEAVEVFDIISPQLSDLTLKGGRCSKIINLIAPQLENLTVIDCSINCLNAPPELSSLCYRGYDTPQLSNDGFHALNKATVCLYIHRPKMPYKEEDARKTICMLQQLHSARYLTLNADIVECISSFPDLLSHLPSPFSNLICLNIDSSMRKDAYRIKMIPQARNFLLENSPSATFIMELPEEPPTKAMKQKEAREKKKAKLTADIDLGMTELQALLELGKMHSERKREKEMVKAAFWNHISELWVLIKQKVMKSEPVRDPIEQVKESAESHKAEMQMQVDQGKTQSESWRPHIELGKVLVDGHKEEMQMQVEQREVAIDSHKAEMQLEGRKAHIESEGVRAGLMAQLEACVGTMQALVNQEIERLEFPISSHEAEMQLEGRKAHIESEEIHAGLMAQLEACVGKMQALVNQEIERLEFPINSHEAEMQLEGRKAHIESEEMHAELMAQLEACVRQMRALVMQEMDDSVSLFSKRDHIRLLLERLPKRQRAKIDSCYSSLLEETGAQNAHLHSEILSSFKTIDTCEKILSDHISIFQNVSSIKIPLASQPPSSSSTNIPTPSTSNINSMP